MDDTASSPDRDVILVWILVSCEIEATLTFFYHFIMDLITLVGDMGPLKDTEFLFDFNRSDDQLDEEPFTDDQSITLKFDVWANQRFSPFLFLQKSFDKILDSKTE